jgi:hypothetical protein
MRKAIFILFSMTIGLLLLYQVMEVTSVGAASSDRDSAAHAFLWQDDPPTHLSYLPFVIGGPPEVYDLSRYLKGDGRLYDVHFQASDFGVHARHQTQVEGDRFYQTKGNEIHAEWEELWEDATYIYRGTDTSPGQDRYYTLYESLNHFQLGSPGSRWSERHMSVGEMYFRKPYVVFFEKADCSLVVGGYYSDPSWLLLQTFHETYTFDSGITLNNVVELAWMLGDKYGPTQPADEVYFYAEDYGLVGWKKSSNGWKSEISEELGPDVPDNNPEHIDCLNSTSNSLQSWSPKLLNGPLPEPYASMVKP